MKQYRVTVLSGSQEFAIFDSAEALYMWTKEPTQEMTGARTISVGREDFLDVEWLGCEFVHEGKSKFSCLNVVHVAFAKATDNESGFVVNPVLGWISRLILPLSESMSKTLKVRQLGPDEGIKLQHPLEEQDDE